MIKVLKNVVKTVLFVLIIIVSCLVVGFSSSNNLIEVTQKGDEEIHTKELFEEYYGKAEELVKEMTLEEKIGQLFLVRYPENNSAINEIENENPGGYILFGVNFKEQTKDSILELIEKNQETSKIPMFFGVDEEGGTVVRVSQYEKFREEKFMSPLELYVKYGLRRIISDSNEKSILLRSLGINMNLAPVVDVPTNTESFMYKRSFGTDAEKTAEFAKEVTTKMKSDKMLSVLKHFPGYGDNVDTHTGIAIDEREYAYFENNDFKPFISGIEAGAPIILVNHNIVKCMDDTLPASLSPNVNKILRDNLNFSGLIITDDLSMGAIEKYSEKAAAQAIKAGNDMIISSNFDEEKGQIIDAVTYGEISEERINESVKRILACKMKYEIIGE